MQQFDFESIFNFLTVLIDIIIEITMNYDIVKKKDGKNYWKIVKQQADFTPNDIDFEMSNLFEGSPQLGNLIWIKFLKYILSMYHKCIFSFVEKFGTQFLKENSKEIFKELGPPVMVKIVKRIVKQIGKFFAAFPAEQVLLP